MDWNVKRGWVPADNQMSGNAKVDIIYKGLVKELSNGRNSDKWKGEGTVQITDVAIFNKDRSKILSNMNGRFNVKSNVLLEQ